MKEVASKQHIGHQRQERRDAAENRERILAAARQLFAAQGVDSTSMKEIAQVAQVGPGTLYRRFAHKGELCETLLADNIITFWERVDATLSAGTPDSALSQLDWFLDELIRLTESHIPLFAAALEAIKLRPNETYRSPFYQDLHQRISDLLTIAEAQGETVDIDVEFTTDVILEAIAPPLYDFQRQHRHFSRERITVGMRRLFVEGLRTR